MVKLFGGEVRDSNVAETMAVREAKRIFDCSFSGKLIVESASPDVNS